MANKNSTIICKLKGGIGNQLFQILFAFNLAKNNQMPVAFELSSYGHDTYGRNPILKDLWPDANVLDVQSIKPSTLKLIKEELLDWPASGALPLTIGASQEEENFLVDGYWQDYRLLTPELLSEFKERISKAVTPATRNLSEKIKNSENPIAIHIRRHDYKHHGICNENYYLDSIKWLSQRLENPTILLFSDEPNYARHFLRSVKFPIHQIATNSDLDDLYLMSSCKHHITSNSTYSWWGAALSGHKHVICPTPWSTIHTPSTTIYPPEWIQVSDAVDAEISTKNFTDSLNTGKFNSDLEQFLQQKGNTPKEIIELQNYANDDTKLTNFDAHYVYHTAWAARRLHDNPVDLHIDISSDIRFCTMASAFQRIEFLDYRPVQISLSNLVCSRTDLLKLDFPDKSLQSLSCMHVVEHIGLGRYGDPINYMGAEIAMSELQRVLSDNGTLYFVTPIGAPKIVFNAHRIFSPHEVIRKFSELQLVEFSYVDDAGNFHEFADINDAKNQNYACGCFLFRRID